MNAIEMRALRKVYKAGGKSKGGSTQGARWGRLEASHRRPMM